MTSNRRRETVHARTVLDVDHDGTPGNRQDGVRETIDERRQAEALAFRNQRGRNHTLACRAGYRGRTRYAHANLIQASTWNPRTFHAPPGDSVGMIARD